MTPEEMLEKAKRDYPIGTKFYSAYNGEEQISEREPFFFDSFNKHIAVKQDRGVVYFKEKWAIPINKQLNYNIY